MNQLREATCSKNIQYVHDPDRFVFCLFTVFFEGKQIFCHTNTLTLVYCERQKRIKLHSKVYAVCFEQSYQQNISLKLCHHLGAKNLRQ